MITAPFIQKLEKSASLLPADLLAQQNIEVYTGLVLNSACLKLYKRSWANPLPNALTATSRIFFSIWVNQETLTRQRLYYNIHALKLRHLQGFTIQSRKFAENFRNSFKKFAPQWPNVNVALGPLTLMEGWVKIDNDNIEHQVTELANNFLKISHLVDDTLEMFKKR